MTTKNGNLKVDKIDGLAKMLPSTWTFRFFQQCATFRLKTETLLLASEKPASCLKNQESGEKKLFRAVDDLGIINRENLVYFGTRLNRL